MADLGSVLDAFTESWERGDRPRAEVFLERVLVEDSAELIYHEYCLAEASALNPDPDDFLRRFPDQAEALSRLFQLHSALSLEDLEGLAEPSGLPQVGDDIGPYRLIRELGEGAFARVFLAEQVDLDDRLVVLKASTRATAEPRLLARASHPHIVPVIRHASTEDGTLHLVCMPYLGGATLGDLLAARHKIGRRPRGGADLIADLDRASPLESPAEGTGRPARELLAGLSYPRAMAWIVARLAEALDHAHRRGVSHGDLKPSNVLLTSDGVPMLFDFNLAVDWRATDDGDGAAGSDAGGTLAYMAPERLLALASSGEPRSTRPPDRHRADLYGLGLVLLEALTGRPPELPPGRPRDQRAMASDLAALRIALNRPPRGRWGRPIPPALGAILGRCLAPDPADRYALGRELAEDLDRFRTDRPLAFADEPRASGLASWARRHRVPVFCGIATVATALGVGGVASFVMAGTLGEQAVDHTRFMDQADAGVFLTCDFANWASDELGDPADNARLQLNRYGALGPVDWTLRDDIRYLPDRDRDEMQAWIVEQIWRHAEAVEDRPDSREDWRAAADRLDRTLGRFPLQALRTTRLALAERLGTKSATAPVAGVAAPRWMEAYLMGVSVEANHAREALAYYRDALEARPGFFWADYRASVVACRINDYPAAARHLRRCVARRPDNPVLHNDLAGVLRKLSRPGGSRTFAWDGAGETLAGDALAECNRALALAPEYPEALDTRSQILRSMGQIDDVRADMDRFTLLTRSRGGSKSLMLRFRSQFAYGPSYVMPTDRAEKALLARALAVSPDDGDLRATLATTLIGDLRLDEAVVECDRILEKDRGHLRARYLRALARHMGGLPDAIDSFAELIDHPRFEELYREDPTAIRAFHYVATDHLKGGRFGKALEVARTGLAHVIRMGLIQDATSLVGESQYLVARVLASSPDAHDRLPAITDHLGRAFEVNPRFRRGWFATDPRFNALREELGARLAE